MYFSGQTQPTGFLALGKISYDNITYNLPIDKTNILTVTVSDNDDEVDDEVVYSNKWNLVFEIIMDNDFDFDLDSPYCSIFSRMSDFVKSVNFIEIADYYNLSVENVTDIYNIHDLYEPKDPILKDRKNAVYFLKEVIKANNELTNR